MFVLVSSLVLATWLKVWNQRQSLKAFQNLAAKNAAFVEQMRLPRSPELAKRLARVLDMGVGFRFGNKEGGEWSEKLDPTIQELTALSHPASGIVGGNEIATAPIGKSGSHLILIRPVPSPGHTFSNGVLFPALGLAVVCGGFGLVLARTIVRPLEGLTQWLPNLDVEPHTTVDPIAPEILHRRDEIGKLARALEETVSRLQREQQLRQQSERLATLGRIATSLAHEIKNPAAAIGMHADVLLQAAKVEQKESLGLIREEVERITDLVNQWLFVAKARPGERKTHDLGELLKILCRRLAPAFEHAKVSMSLKVENEAMVEVDSTRIEQALRNLLINAAQSMSRGGEVQAHLELIGTSVNLKIQDMGPGFSEEALQRFGEPFFSEKEGGMGIGLTLAKDVIEAHGGSIRPENQASGGAMVICELPLKITKAS